MLNIKVQRQKFYHDRKIKTEKLRNTNMTKHYSTKQDEMCVNYNGIHGASVAIATFQWRRMSHIVMAIDRRI